MLEIHPWGSALATLEQPDRIIMDLDPGEGVAWSDVIAAAKEVKQRFAEFGLASFVKTTGGKGLHVVAPLKPSAGWDEVKNFSRDIALSMAADAPELLRRDNHQIETAWKNPDRLSPQRPRRDSGRALFDACTAGRAGVHAARLG